MSEQHYIEECNTHRKAKGLPIVNLALGEMDCSKDCPAEATCPMRQDENDAISEQFAKIYP